MQRDRWVSGDRIRNVRKRAGLTQAEVAELAELSEETVRRAEHGKVAPSGDTMARISNVLGISVEALRPGQVKRQVRHRVSALAERYAEQFSRLSPVQQRAVSQIVRDLLRAASGARTRSGDSDRRRRGR